MPHQSSYFPFPVLFRAIVVVACILAAFPVFSQDFENYSPLECSGKIPEVFRTSSLEKYESDRQNIDQDHDLRRRKDEQRFYLRSNYLLDELLLSGQVLFNDPLTHYVNKVADELLKSDPELRSKLQFFAVKSPYVNAFTTDAGVVLVNVGLLAKLETEAQLAFILAHEAIHYQRKHVLNSYIESKKIERGQGQYGRAGMDDQIMAKSQYSKELELEADLAGLRLYIKSGYSLESLLNVFDVLHNAKQPFAEVAFDKTFFETEHLVFPDTYFKETLDTIVIEEDYDDSLSTHPNTEKRKAALAAELDGMDNGKRKEFLYSELEFLKVRTIARFELSRYYLLSQDYGRCIYHSYSLLQDFPDNHYLLTNITNSLYGLSRFKNSTVLSYVLDLPDDMPGESQQVYYFLRQLTKKELSVTALVWTRKMIQKFPEDEHFKLLLQDLTNDLASVHKLTPGDFELNPYEPPLPDSLPAKPDTILLDSLPKEEVITPTDPVDDTYEDVFIDYALIDALADSTFLSSFENSVISYRRKKNVENFMKRKERHERVRNRRLERRHGKALGIDSLVLVDPFYRSIDVRKKDNLKVKRSEKRYEKFLASLRKNARMNELHLEILDLESLEDHETDRFNDYVRLTEWLKEDMARNRVDMSYFTHERVKHLKERYGTPYFAWAGTISVKRRSYIDPATRLYGSLFVVPIPYMIYRALTPAYDTYYFFMVFDLEKQELLLSEWSEFHIKDRGDLTHSKVYDSFYQVKRSEP